MFLAVCALVLVCRACLGDALLPLQHRDGASGLGQVQRASQTHDAAAHNDDGRGSLLPHLLPLWRKMEEEDKSLAGKYSADASE